MKKYILSVSFVVIALQSFAAVKAADNSKDRMALIRDTLKRRTLQTGGFLIKPNTGTGNVIFINCQDKINHSTIENIARQLQYISRINITAVKGAKDLKPYEAQKIHNADIAIMITSDPNNRSLMLLAPEEGWGVVNFNRVPQGNNYKPGCCKALMRTFALLCCGGLSMQEDNLLHVAKLEDAYNLKDVLPHDVVNRQLKYLAGMNVTPRVRVTYKKACEEGWAPAPTNDIQKAIWDKVHAMPTAPIKINPETKKVRE